MQIRSSTVSVAPHPLLSTDALLPNDIVTQSRQRAEKELPAQLRSLAERVHLNMEKAYKIYREKEIKAFQQVEQAMNSPIVDPDIHDIDLQYLSNSLNQERQRMSSEDLSFLVYLHEAGKAEELRRAGRPLNSIQSYYEKYTLPISNTVRESSSQMSKVLDSLSKESDQLIQAIASRIEELDAALNKEHSRLSENIERITKITERRLESISSGINELRNEKYRLNRLSPTPAIDSRIRELNHAIDALIEEQYKAYEDRRKAIEEEENKSHQSSEELRTKQKKLKSFNSYWREYLSVQRRKIYNWLQNRLHQFSNAFLRLSTGMTNACLRVAQKLLQLNPSWALNVASSATHAGNITGSGARQPFHYAKQGVDLVIANVSVAAIPVSIGARVIGAVAEKVGLASVANYFNNRAKSILRGVAENWSSANEGPLGRAFDTQIHAVTSPLEPLIGHNQQFLADWITGNLPARIVYDPNSIQIRDMRESLNVKRAKDEFYAEGAPKLKKFCHPTSDAYWETMVNPFTANWKSTAMQVGGYAGATITNNGDGTMTIRIKNVAGINSFFYHLLPNLPSKTGPMHSVEQIFEWTEPIDPTRAQPINGITGTEKLQTIG